MELYGGICACCGESRFAFLTIDHIDGGGTKHRQNFTSNQAFYRWLLDERRDGFQVLCYNCNCAKGAFGECPHEFAKRLAEFIDATPQERYQLCVA